MSSSIVNSLNLAAISVFGAQVPSAGPQAVPVSVDVSLQSQYTVDYSNEINSGKLQLCQTVFIDASNVDNAVSVSFNGTGQTIVVPGRTQGYYSVLAPNPLRLTIACPGLIGPASALVNVFLINFPVANAQWSTV
jgi:hypothetical protein